MAWIDKDGTRYYRITRTVGKKLNENGVAVPIRKEFTALTKKAAVMKYEEFMANKTNTFNDAGLYFGIVADQWIENFFIPDKSLKDSSKSQYLSSWNKHIKTADFYNAPLREVTSIMVQKRYNELFVSGVASNSIRYAHLLLRKFYKYIETEDMGRNITGSLTVPTEEKSVVSKDVVVWTDDEVDKILNGFDKADSRFRFKFLIVLAYYTGCRIGELLGLTYDDIKDGKIFIEKQHGRKMIVSQDGDVSTTYDISTPKTASSVRNLPMHQAAMTALSEHRSWHLKEQLRKGYRTNYIFTTDTGKLYDPTNIRTALNRYYKRIGVEPKPIHTYRHTFGTNLCKNGVPIQTASKLMGHSSIEVTAKYYINTSDEEKAIAIDKLS